MRITKIVLHNFKRFSHLEMDVNRDLNIFIGDNESGKSSILQAIDITSRGSRYRIEEIGLDRLFNVSAIQAFMNGPREIDKMPMMFVELYVDANEEDLEGEINSSKRNFCGIRLKCCCDDNYSLQISQILKQPDATFPLEFYSITFETFSGKLFNAYDKKLNDLMIDNSQIGSPYSMHEYIRDIYHSRLDEVQRIDTRHKYHNKKTSFQNEVLSTFNAGIAPYSFAIRENSESNIETDITLTEDGVPLENKGTGTLCFIKTELAIKKSVNGIDAVLIEEPESHLCYTKMLELINLIKGSDDRQLFISTHSDLISTRLDLNKCFMFNSESVKYVCLSKISSGTAQFFKKAPDNNMLQFVLSKKAVLVEGDAEFILMEKFYKTVTSDELAKSGVGIIAVDGKCFKRYLEIAKLLNNKVAVITDNDGNFEANITSSYANFCNDKIKVFSDTDNARFTFEVCVYKDNQTLCDTMFSANRRTLSVQDYMLSNKAEAAFLLLDSTNDVTVPEYIQNAIKWIKD